MRRRLAVVAAATLSALALVAPAQAATKDTEVGAFAVSNDPDGLDRYEVLAPKIKPSRGLTCRAARGLVLTFD